MKNYPREFFLKDKIIFVAGGAGLLGGEIAQAVSQWMAVTVILDVNRKKGKALEQKICKEGGKACFEFFDMTRLGRIEQNLQRLIKKYGRLDGWVNASYPRTRDWGLPLEKVKIKSFQKNIDMHLNSYIWSSRLAALEMKKNKIQGAIVNLGSIYGVQGNDFTVYHGTNMTTPMAYSSIKGGIVNGTRFLASYFGRYGIRVNTVCPGAIFDHQERKFVRNYQEKVPLQRLGKPEDVAGVVCFLLSKASSYMTGATVMVDGGWSIV